MEKVLLDTDIGGDIDDAICLAYLLKEPRCRLMGITTVCGQPEKRAAVADAICRAADSDCGRAGHHAAANSGISHAQRRGSVKILAPQYLRESGCSCFSVSENKRKPS